jgi:hypothetical protein
MGLIGENLGRAKGLRYLNFFPSLTSFYYYYGVSMGIRVDNSIRLKELQVVSGALRKRDKGLGFFYFLFQKGFFWVRRRGWGNSTPFQRSVFFKGLG